MKRLAIRPRPEVIETDDRSVEQQPPGEIGRRL